MVEKVETAVVSLWGDQVGAVSWLSEKGYAIFEFSPTFLQKGLEISPIHMALDQAGKGGRTFSFPALNKATYLGLPGLLADSLPDKFGNSIIDSWLARKGRDSSSFSPVERLCYMGKRGMGALEFSPPVDRNFEQSVEVEIADLVQLSQEIMTQRSNLDVTFGTSGKEKEEAIIDILRVGTSAGGARPKAIIAMDNKGNILSGQADVPKNYEYWLLKFDGVSDLELGESKSFGRIEYAYYLMAKRAGIDMTECRLLEENGRAHFLTKRFDRIQGEKLHMQSLCSLAHYDYNQAGETGYEQLFAVMRSLRLNKAEAMEQYRRMLFHVIARNQDDHTKNFSFLMNPSGKWKLAPAFDVTYSHNPAGIWTNRHQMSINGKRDGFTRQDLLTVGRSISLPKPQEILEEVIQATSDWPKFANEAGITTKISKVIQNNFRSLE